MTPAEKDVASPRPIGIASTSSLLLFVLIALLFVAARLWRLTASCLWFDEIFSVHATRYGWKQMFQFVAADLIHPPLFYVLLKIWIAIGGESLLWLRLLPVLLSVVAVVPIVLLCRALKLTNLQTLIALALLAVNGYLIKYAQEVRMYSLLFLLSCTSLWLFVKFTAATKLRWIWVALTIVNLLLVYSHYYGWILVIVELLSLIVWWRERVRKFIWIVFVLIASYLPWLNLIINAKEPGRGLAQNIGWVAKPGIGDVVQFFAFLNTPFFFQQSSVPSRSDIWGIGLAVLAFGVPLALLIREIAKRRSADSRSIWMLLGFILVPIALVFILSWIFTYSIWGTRHLIIVSAPYSILAAMALSRMKESWLRTACFVLIGGWMFLNGAVTVIRRPTNLTWCSWEPLAQQVARVETNAPQRVDVYAFEDLVAYHLWFAFENTAESDRVRIHAVKGIKGLQEDPAYFLPRRFYEIETHDGPAFKGDSIWLAFRDSQWNPNRPPLNLLPAQNLETGRVFELQAQGQKSFLVEVLRRGQTQ